MLNAYLSSNNDNWNSRHNNNSGIIAPAIPPTAQAEVRSLVTPLRLSRLSGCQLGRRPCHPAEAVQPHELCRRQDTSPEWAVLQVSEHDSEEHAPDCTHGDVCCCGDQGTAATRAAYYGVAREALHDGRHRAGGRALRGQLRASGGAGRAGAGGRDRRGDGARGEGAVQAGTPGAGADDRDGGDGAGRQGARVPAAADGVPGGAHVRAVLRARLVHQARRLHRRQVHVREDGTGVGVQARVHLPESGAVRHDGPDGGGVLRGAGHGHDEPGAAGAGVRGGAAGTGGGARGGARGG